MSLDHQAQAADSAGDGRAHAVTATGLDAVAEPMFDIIASLVRTLLDVPVALVSLIDAERQSFPGAARLHEP